MDKQHSQNRNNTLDTDYYPDDGSHKYHELSDVEELDENQDQYYEPYYPDKTYEPTNDGDKPQFPTIDSDQYYTPDESPDSSYHTANDGPYEDLEDFCCRYCADQHPDNWCPIPHYSCLDTCLVLEDHPHYIDDVPVDVTCPAEGQQRPYSYWA